MLWCCRYCFITSTSYYVSIANAISHHTLPYIFIRSIFWILFSFYSSFPSLFGFRLFLHSVIFSYTIYAHLCFYDAVCIKWNLNSVSTCLIPLIVTSTVQFSEIFIYVHVAYANECDYLNSILITSNFLYPKTFIRCIAHTLYATYRRTHTHTCGHSASMWFCFCLYLSNFCAMSEYGFWGRWHDSFSLRDHMPYIVILAQNRCIV